MFIFCSILGLWTDSPTRPISQRLFCMRRAGREWVSLLPALACASGPRRNSRELWRPDSMVIPLLLKTGGSFRSSCRNPFGPWLGSAFRTGALRYIRPLIDGSGLYPAGYISGLYPEGYNQLIWLRIAGLARTVAAQFAGSPPDDATTTIHELVRFVGKGRVVRTNAGPVVLACGGIPGPQSRFSTETGRTVRERSSGLT